MRTSGSVAVVLSLLCMGATCGVASDARGQDQIGVGSRASEVESKAAQEVLRSVGVTVFTQEKFNQVYNEMLQTRDQRLLPYVEERFEKAETHGDKLTSSAYLVYLRHEDPRYWSYLSEEARRAIESQMPNSTDSSISRDGPRTSERPEFRAWREERNLSLPEALELQNHYYSAVRMLGGTLDPRAVDLLLEGLEVDNALILRGVLFSLARLQDPRTVEPIVSALEAQPVEVAKAMADVLLYFDDEIAQSEAARLIGDRVKYEQLRAHIEEVGTRSIYGY